MLKARNDEWIGSLSPLQVLSLFSPRQLGSDRMLSTLESINKPSCVRHTALHFHRPGKQVSGSQGSRPRACSWETGQEEQALLRTFQNFHPSGGGAQDHKAAITPFPETLLTPGSLLTNAVTATF